MKLWSGGSERTLDRVLEALYVERIPFHYKAPVEVTFSARLEVTYEVRVLRTDIERARSAIALIE